jgi:hypothetical protein
MRARTPRVICTFINLKKQPARGDVKTVGIDFCLTKDVPPIGSRGMLFTAVVAWTSARPLAARAHASV